MTGYLRHERGWGEWWGRCGCWTEGQLHGPSGTSATSPTRSREAPGPWQLHLSCWKTRQQNNISKQRSLRGCEHADETLAWACLCSWESSLLQGQRTKAVLAKTGLQTFFSKSFSSHFTAIFLIDYVMPCHDVCDCTPRKTKTTLPKHDLHGLLV